MISNLMSSKSSVVQKMALYLSGIVSAIMIEITWSPWRLIRNIIVYLLTLSLCVLLLTYFTCHRWCKIHNIIISTFYFNITYYVKLVFVLGLTTNVLSYSFIWYLTLSQEHTVPEIPNVLIIITIPYFSFI